MYRVRNRALTVLLPRQGRTRNPDVASPLPFLVPTLVQSRGALQEGGMVRRPGARLQSPGPLSASVPQQAVTVPPC